MNPTSEIAFHRLLTSGAPRPRLPDRLARRAVLTKLAGLRRGCITLVDGDTAQVLGNRADPLHARVEVTDARFYSALALGGSVGAGEAYMQGWWRCDNLTSLVRIMVLNLELVDGMEGGTAALARPARKLFHWFNRNTRRGSGRNIAAHYDLGNEFFRLFLDETMMYSSAVFERPDMTLAEASRAKLDRICRKLDLKPDDHVLEIGTGWGGFALHAAGHYGCRVTTTTISAEQYELAADRVQAAGLADRITLLRRDYRDLEGRYDKLVSIEMIEAVGHQYYDSFFRTCSRLLKDDGAMLLQAITIADQRYEQARRSVDFIQRYIFPGSCIPSLTVMANSIARSGDLRIDHLEDIGEHYATTLRHWRENLFSSIERVRALGVPESFIRMWEFYFCYCEGGFAERAIGDAQLRLVKPGWRSPVR